MPIIWYKGKTELASKRAAMSEERKLKKRGYRTSIEERMIGKAKQYGVKYN